MGEARSHHAKRDSEGNSGSCLGVMNDPEVGSRETVRDGLPGERILGKKWSLRVSLGSPTERGRWVLSSARLLQRPSFDESKKRALKVGGLEVGKGDILVLSCSWGVYASEGRISNPGHLPSFKSYLNCRTWSCPSEDCLKIAPGTENRGRV